VAVAERVRGSVLDCGCGTGENALYFAARGHKVTGIDWLEEPIRRARQKAAERGLTANFLVLDATALDQMPEQFDTALDCGLYHGFSDEDRAKYVAGLATVVLPGGRLFLMCFSDAEPPGQGPRRITRGELEASFAAGWRIETIEAARFETRPDLPEFAFSPGGPQAWFATVARA
jgi:cyclopropane fatty-acyl-phospholipid synthase-like methyltransferase